MTKKAATYRSGTMAHMSSQTLAARSGSGKQIGRAIASTASNARATIARFTGSRNSTRYA